ncbi:swr1 complex component [Diatrype stigma]|uniref:DNA helicase n=1 Tax=Diatrype stigma TaxID=117547 RepID=A0AAN9U5A5_9PEZI
MTGTASTEPEPAPSHDTTKTNEANETNENNDASKPEPLQPPIDIAPRPDRNATDPLSSPPDSPLSDVSQLEAFLSSPDGKRRSGRTNAPPVAIQPLGQKRPTRGSLGSHSTPTTKDNKRSAATNGHTNGSQRHPPAGKATASKSSAPPSKPVTKKPLTNGVRSSPRTQKQPPAPIPQSSPKRSLRTSRSSRTLRNRQESPASDSKHGEQEGSNSRSTKIRFRVRPTTIPIVHPAQVNVFPGQTIARPKIGSSFEEYLGAAPDIDVKDGGWFDSADEGPSYTQEMAEKDAGLILRIEDEVQPGGLLSQERSSIYVPEPAEGPPRQWAHEDHLVKQMANFRKLMLMEQQRHKSTAKRLAEACRDEWIRRQPKSAEQIEAEAHAMWTARYRTVVKVVAGTWENVRTEINRRRLEEWEAAEQKRVKAALNEAVNMSEMKLQARRAHAGSDLLSDEDEDDEVDDMDDTDMEISLDEDDGLSSDGDLVPEGEAVKDEDNMSSSDDEDEDAKSTASDEGLTQDQLRQKYANVPELPQPDRPMDDVHSEDPGETTDESVDMDDDLGSSNDEMASPEDDDEESEESDAETEGQSGLLGLFFGKSELKKLKEEVTVNDGSPSTDDVGPVEGTTTTLDGMIATADTDQPAKTVGSDGIANFSSGSSAEISTGKSFDQGSKSQDTTQENEPRQKPTDLAAHVRPPTNPLDANKPDEPPAAPGPLQMQDVEMQIIDAVEHAKDAAGAEIPTSTALQEPSAVSNVKATTASTEKLQTSPDADVDMSPPSRDRSQSPRTSDTKPSDVDTAPTTVKSATSRSASPLSQVPKTEVPFLLRGSLREYQHYGLDWLAGLYKNKTNGILADEMGLGKTIQTIALLAHLACQHEVWGPHLVIVPTSVMLNWEMEFKKWCPGFKVLSYYGSIEERKRKRQGWKTNDMWNVCITSYQIVLQDQQVFKRRQWHCMILDEAHNIKNFKSKRWQTLLTFNTQARLLLTGTPLQNNLTELWSLLFFLMPSENGVGGFADLAEFQDWFHKPESQILESGREQMDEEARAIIAKLHKVLRPYLLRRLKADVEKQMPAKHEHVEFCRLSRRQRELYDGFLARADTRDALASGNYISVINCLMQLRKVCNHPDLFVERPIMTSFRQSRSIVAEYEPTESLVRGKLLVEDPMMIVSKSFLNLVPTEHESLSKTECERISQLSSHRTLLDLRETQRIRAQAASTNLDPSTVESNITYLESAARWGRFEELQHCVYLNALRRQQRPIYGKRLTNFLTLGINERPHKPKPKVPRQVMSWFEEDSPVLRSMVLTLDQRAASMKSTISKFACITPVVVTRDMDRLVLGAKGVEAFTDADLKLSAPVRYAPFMPKEPHLDPWHESRMRLSIQFPDRRLLQYDCGKLQALDRLLRKLQSGGHRALIFTQMTKVLDILEQFLNIHGHKYLRLDGATKVEQRQILTDRFNHDTRILCFILSTRSGGLGINLTGADTVIFYDQDWNPAMDKQCQDRCHRIGQTRDVHIYRLVSEHTIEANILRKASQKQMLDDVVIQEGGFTTDYFTKKAMRDAAGSAATASAGEEDVVGDAMDRVLGGVVESTGGRVLEQAEDREDIAAARVAEKEIQEDEADFAEKPVGTGSSSASTTTSATRDASAALTTGAGGGGTGIGRSNLGLYAENAAEIVEDEAQVAVEYNAYGERMCNIDDYMLGTMAALLEGTPLELPKDHYRRGKKGGGGGGGGKNAKKGKDTRKR